MPTSGTTGSTKTISSITPDTGYSIGTVSVVRNDNGNALTVSGSGSSRTFTMPASTVTVSVSFTAISYTITKSTPTNGSFTVPASGTGGSTITISSINPNTGYSIDMVRVVRNDNGIELTVSGSGSSRTFSMPYCAVTVSVSFTAISYTITKSASTNGSFSVPASGTIGSTITISSITPDASYSLDMVRVVRNDNGTELTVSGSGSSRTFSMPACAVTVSVSFTLTPYTIIKSTPISGSFSVPTLGPPGSTITISSITPDFGYSIDMVRVVRNDNGTELTVNGSGSARTFTMPYCAVTVSVTFKEIYDIIKSTPTNGSFTVPASETGGSTITISSIAPDFGYSIDMVRVVRNDNGTELTISGSGSSRTFTMPYCAVTVSVSFTLTPYAITKSTPVAGSFSVPTSGTGGSTITISSITPDNDYSIDMVSVVRNDNGTELTVSGTGDSRTFTMPYCAVTVSVSFTLTPYTIIKSTPTNGSFTVPALGTPGSTITISSITADFGYSIDMVRVVRNDNGIELTVNGSGNYLRTFTMPYCDVTVSVTFKEIYTITKSTPTNGSFTVPTSGIGGSTIMISSITPDAGYSLDMVRVVRNDSGTELTVSGSGNSRIFTMPYCDVTVDVSFILTPYTIIKSTPADGSFTVPTLGTPGSTITISSITPDAGYSIDVVSVVRNDNGIELTVSGSDDSRTFTMPYCDVTVAVSFTLAPYAIIKSTSAEGSFTVPASGIPGSTITISSITPDFGYSIDMVRVVRNDNGIELTVSGSGSSRTFTMPYCEVTVNISFKETYDIIKSTLTNGSFEVLESGTGGSTITISSITPDAGYLLDMVRVVRNDNGIELTVSGTGDSRTFTMPYCAVTVSVSFTAIPYTIIKATTTDGSFEVPAWGTPGSAITISITPDMCRIIDTVRVVRNDSGMKLTLIGSGDIRTFIMPYCDVTVTVSFMVEHDYDATNDTCVNCGKHCDFNTFIDVTETEVGGNALTVNYRVNEVIPDNIIITIGYDCYRVLQDPFRNDHNVETTPGSYSFTMPMPESVARYKVKGYYWSWVSDHSETNIKDYCLPDSPETIYHKVTKSEEVVDQVSISLLNGLYAAVFIPATVPIVISVISGTVISVGLGEALSSVSEGQYVVITSGWEGDEIHVHTEIYCCLTCYEDRIEKNIAPISVNDIRLPLE